MSPIKSGGCGIALNHTPVSNFVTGVCQRTYSPEGSSSKSLTLGTCPTLKKSSSNENKLVALLVVLDSDKLLVSLGGAVAAGARMENWSKMDSAATVAWLGDRP